MLFRSVKQNLDHAATVEHNWSCREQSWVYESDLTDVDELHIRNVSISADWTTSTDTHCVFAQNSMG